MVDVLQISVPKDRLRAMPKDERVLFFRLGYAANQITMFQKLLVFSSNRTPTDPIDERLSNVQTEMLLRITMGLLFEGWLIIERSFLARPLGRDYQALLDNEAQQALGELKRLFGKSKVLSIIRNNFAFHFPTVEQVEDAFDAAFADATFDEEWNLFFAKNKFNSLYMLCDVVFTHALFKSLGEDDWAAGQIRIMEEMRVASESLISFCHGFTAAVWKKHIGPEMIATVCAKVDDAPDLQSVMLPFLAWISTEANHPNVER
jgi:hypothetical protein